MPTSVFLRRCCSGLAALSAAVLTAHAGTFKTITIDGSFGDWAGVPVAYEDPADSTDSVDYRRIYLANDDDYLYVRFTLERGGNPFLSNANIFVDTDNSFDTGYKAVVGSEMLIQGGAAYDERGGGFNEGGVNGLGWLAAPTGEATEFEVRIARNATYGTDGTAVFTGDTLALLLEAEDSNFARKETAPDTEGLVYTFASAPPPLTSAQTLATLTGTTWRVNDSGNDLGTAWKETDFDDSGAGWKSGAGLFGYTPTPGSYPAAITTPLAVGSGTVYLRTTFAWNFSPQNLVFAISNYLSDGAVIYLNGAEVRRVRLPDGTVGFGTPATGGPATAGQVEVFGISGAPLVTGDNILAVELHQTPASAADLVFGLSLTATPSYPVSLVNPAEPADRTVVAGDATTFTAEVLGTPPLTYEWRKGTDPIPGATGPSYTLNPVLKSDEGTYSLKVTNPGGTVTTRAATLTVTVTPVTITDATLPANLTVAEGSPATFTVAVAGSPVISYQWLKGGFPITDATAATYTIPAAGPDDAGDYSVQVSNPATPLLLSRTATLVVLKDQTAPTIATAAGSPNQVTVTFSEPVDPTTAGDKSHYTISGLTVTGATVSADNAAVVVLATSKQTLFTDYTLLVSGVQDRFGNVILPASSKKFRSTIVIDGSFDDWADVAVAYTDANEAPAAGTDFKDISVANDDQYLYIHFTLYAAGDPGTYLNNIFVDADPDNAGFGTYGIGSEMLIQSGSGYQQKNGAFNEGGINGLDFAMLPTGQGTEFELRISRAATYATDGLPVFVADTIKFFLETENASFVTTDTAPDTGGLEYTFVSVAPGDLGPLVITPTAGKLVITWTGAGRLQSRSSATDGDWADVTGAVSGIQITPEGAAQFYRLTQ
ncbi:MAG TPA: immunoglobulin domain-containing protein [Candidatus Limnocylindria bacterium]|jgi:hypothetical protein|nr:immunoglobulin domain-containing protein [Candidatus Limnocylindria bacterium]